MSNDSSSSSNGLHIADILGIIFIVLKLLNIIDWSWWWVLSPFWISIILALFIIGIAKITDY